MNGLVPVLILIGVSVLLWVIYFFTKSSGGKNVNANFKAAAEKYGLIYDDTNSSGGVVYPIIKGVYKNRHAAIGCFIDSSSSKKIPNTYVRIECSNPRKLAFEVIKKNKKTALDPGGNTVQMLDSEFDEQFIVRGSDPSHIFPLFSFNIKYSLVQAQNLGFAGRLKLENNLLDYTEPALMKDENSRTRVELIMHILCDIADELDKQP